MLNQLIQESSAPNSLTARPRSHQTQSRHSPSGEAGTSGTLPRSAIGSTGIQPDIKSPGNFGFQIPFPKMQSFQLWLWSCLAEIYLKFSSLELMRWDKYHIFHEIFQKIFAKQFHYLLNYETFLNLKKPQNNMFRNHIRSKFFSNRNPSGFALSGDFL